MNKRWNINESTMVHISSFYPPWVCLRRCIWLQFQGFKQGKDKGGVLSSVRSPEGARVRATLINQFFCNLIKKHKGIVDSFWNIDWKWKGIGSILSGSSTCKRKHSHIRQGGFVDLSLWIFPAAALKQVQHLYCILFTVSLGHTVLLPNVPVVILCVE